MIFIEKRLFVSGLQQKVILAHLFDFMLVTFVLICYNYVTWQYAENEKGLIISVKGALI